MWKELSKHVLPIWPCHPCQVCNTNSTSFHDDGDGDHISGACASWRGSTHKSHCTRRRSTKAAQRPRHTTTSRTSSSWPMSHSSENSESLRLVTCHNLLVLSSKHAGSNLNQLGSVGWKRAQWILHIGLLPDWIHLAQPGNDTVSQNQIRSGLVLHNMIRAVCGRTLPSLKLKVGHGYMSSSELAAFCQNQAWWFLHTSLLLDLMHLGKICYGLLLFHYKLKVTVSLLKHMHACTHPPAHTHTHTHIHTHTHSLILDQSISITYLWFNKGQGSGWGGQGGH